MSRCVPFPTTGAGATVNITLQVRDRNGVSVPGVLVVLEITAGNATLEQPAATNAAGQSTGALTSITPTQAVLRALLPTADGGMIPIAKELPIFLGMVALDGLPGTTYCMDQFEVSNAEYYPFSDGGVPATQPARCAWNTSYAPHIDGGAYPFPPGGDTLPVVAVDYCDSVAFCAARGKHLCGELGGGLYDHNGDTYERANDPDVSEWLRACSSNGATLFPYGSLYNGSRCNGVDSSMGSPDDGFSYAQCSVNGIHHLSGNVLEWENACELFMGNTYCMVRGGAFTTDEDSMACTYGDFSEGPYLAATTYVDTGFRCCGLVSGLASALTSTARVETDADGGVAVLVRAADETGEPLATSSVLFEVTPLAGVLQQVMGSTSSTGVARLAASPSGATVKITLGPSGREVVLPYILTVP